MQVLFSFCAFQGGAKHCQKRAVRRSVLCCKAMRGIPAAKIKLRIGKINVDRFPIRTFNAKREIHSEDPLFAFHVGKGLCERSKRFYRLRQGLALQHDLLAIPHKNAAGIIARL